MKKYLLLLSIVSVFAFFSCKDENDDVLIKERSPSYSPFELIMINESQEEILDFFYQSMDPACGFPYKYYIYAESEVRDIVIKCENFDTVYVNQEKSYSYCSDPSFKTDSIDINITDGNYINITFPEIKLDKEFFTEYFLKNDKFPAFENVVYIEAEKEGEIVEDYIWIYRWLPKWFTHEIILLFEDN